jgi:mannose-6-phosphate isomerase-like protein (cupin superfamily)
MQPVKSFTVFGEPDDLLVDSAMSHGTAAVMIQTTRPGGGPPPHMHTREDETFTALEGEFEILSEGKWSKIAVGEVVFAPRGHIHTFRNCGGTSGKMLIFVSPAGFENYLQEVGPLSPATDMAKIIEISNRFGISFHPA